MTNNAFKIKLVMLLELLVRCSTLYTIHAINKPDTISPKRTINAFRNPVNKREEDEEVAGKRSQIIHADKIEIKSNRIIDDIDFDLFSKKELSFKINTVATMRNKVRPIVGMATGNKLEDD